MECQTYVIQLLVLDTHGEVTLIAVFHGILAFHLLERKIVGLSNIGR